MNTENPNIKGIDEVLNVLKNSFSNIVGGPILLSPLLREAFKNIRSKEGSTQYNVLLILTRGAIEDVDSVKNLIVEGSDLPLSIIIIGIGEGDFTMMKELDAKHEAIRDVLGN